MKKLIIILALALILRLISIGEPLYVDEAFTYTVAQSPSTALHATFSAEEHPPLFNLLASFFRYLTGQVWALRLFSVFAGVATVMFAYLACRQLLSEKASLITAFLVSISPLFIKMSQQLRPYMLQPMLVFASMYFFLKAMRTDSKKAWAGYIIMAVLSGYTSHFSVLMMAALLLVAVLFKKHFKSFKNFIISEAVIALLLIPNLIYAYFQLNYLGFMAEYSP
ncbi:MAG: glycosyltransferase family 39 protein [Nanoarchaeota archaeon]|nr:glycosyltransferase family 39 protein [Nanoarchaeota archaeon]